MISVKAIIESNLIVIIVNLKTFFHFQQNQSEIANMGIRSLSGFGRFKAVGICIQIYTYKEMIFNDYEKSE